MKHTTAILLLLASLAGAPAASYIPEPSDGGAVLTPEKMDNYGHWSITLTNDIVPGEARVHHTLRTNHVTHATTLLSVGGSFAWICPTGYSTIVNPFVPRLAGRKISYAVTNLIEVTNTMVLYTFLQASNQFVVASAFTNGSWTDPNLQMTPRRPLFVGNFSGSPFTNVFLGEISTGDFTNKITPGWNFLCSTIFKDGQIRGTENGALSQRGLQINVADNVDTVKVYHDAAWRESEYVDEEWSAISGYYVSVNDGPRISIGQCFLYYNGTSATNLWVQSAHY